jgi:hypothetical protein
MLRLLLLHVRGAQSFEELRLVNGELCESYQEACVRLGLLADDREWQRCLQEASLTHMPFQMRFLFAHICAFCNPSNPVQLWQTFSTDMCEDYLNQSHRHNEQLESLRRIYMPDSDLDQFKLIYAKNIALYEIKRHLGHNSVNLAELGLDEPNQQLIPHNILDTIHEQVGEYQFDQAIELQVCNHYRLQLNEEQRFIFDRIENNLHNNNNNEQSLLFVEGQGGSGKTFLYTAICHLVRSLNKVILPTAWTGIAASLLVGGQTYHSRFALPVPYTKESSSLIRAQSPEANYIRKARVILCDEASMMPGHFLVVRHCLFHQELFESKKLLHR